MSEKNISSPQRGNTPPQTGGDSSSAAGNGPDGRLTSGILAEGARVLTNEAEGLRALAENLGEELVAAVELLWHLPGRVAVSGMGKSGHVARKVAATLASTGTPAYFIHPAEATHGDLGMISAQDAVVAFSNSGETEELAGLLVYCARNQIPVVGVTKNRRSFLGRQSSVVLALPDIPEACPFGSAPTTSTTMMMALGDALALCLLKAKGFTPEQFHQYHPGGSLGRKLLAVRDIMHTGDKVPLVAAGQPMSEVLYAISGKSLGCAGVLEDGGALAGIITDGDLRRHMTPDLLQKKAGEIMTRKPVTIEADTLAAEALGLMQKKSITALFVLDEQNRPVGLVHIHDCLRAGLQ